jgi:uncharacterized membrane protein
MTDAAATRPLFFDAVLYPHRSLGRRGFWTVMAIFAGASLFIGSFFFLLGAWPVVGFLGLDILLLFFALRWSYRGAGLREYVRLGRDALEVERREPNGRARIWRFEPHWLRVEIDEPPEHDSQLQLVSHGKRFTIGAFLSPPERLDLAHALRAALHRRRTAIYGAG